MLEISTPFNPSKPEVHPQALEIGFRERTREYQTGRLFGKLTSNLRKEGITHSWNQYMDVMNTVVSARAEAASNGRLALTVSFADEQTRDNFSRLCQHILAGTHGPTGLSFLGRGTQELTVENFGHEDLVTLGRVGTALFLDEYGTTLRQNIRLLRQHSIGSIEDSGVLELLPAELRERLTEQKAAIGKVASNTLLTSGVGISKIGATVRIASNDRSMQRSKNNTPKIEEGIRFYYTSPRDSGAVVVSSTTTGKLLKEQGKDFMDRQVSPMRDGDIVQRGEAAYDMVTGVVSGGKLLTGGFSLARALFTSAKGATAAIHGFFAESSDRWDARVERDGIDTVSGITRNRSS